jgi:hypothetical protein
VGTEDGAVHVAAPAGATVTLTPLAVVLAG